MKGNEREKGNERMKNNGIKKMTLAQKVSPGAHHARKKVSLIESENVIYDS